MPVVPEHDVGLFELAVPLDVDLIEPVDEDVGDVGVAQQRLERTETEQLVEHVDDERFALGQAERRRPRLALDQLHDERADLRLGILASHARQTFEVQAIQQLLMDPRLQLLIVAESGLRGAPRSVPQEWNSSGHDP